MASTATKKQANCIPKWKKWLLEATEVRGDIGLRAYEIAKLLCISVHTVKTHVNHIFDKLDVNDRAQAAVWASKNGLL